MSEQSDISGARHLASRLRAESLQSREILRATDQGSVRQLIPNLTVVKVGGSSIFDRGPEALLGVARQLAGALDERRLVICVGEGIRARHAYSIAQDLELPPGMLSSLGHSTSEQNALILGALLMDHGAVDTSLTMLPNVLATGAPAVISGMPPYGWWEPPPAAGRVPEYRSDAGTFLIAEAFGARKVIYIKDQDTMFTDDPADDPNAEPIERTTASELLSRGLPKLPFEPVALEMLSRARVVEKIQLVNGLSIDGVSRALAGEPVGTTITRG